MTTVFLALMLAGCEKKMDEAVGEAEAVPAPPPLVSCPDVLPAVVDERRVGCRCESWAIHAGPVWGQGPYTLDSDVCAAALHSGVIGADGGPLTLEIVEGCPHYTAGTAHGVSTHAADATEWALVFQGVEAACSEP